MDVQELREVPAMLERLDFDDAVGIYASGKVFEAAYERLGLEVPLWVTENLAMLQKYIVAKRKDNFATYNQPTLPLSPGFIPDIVAFIKK